MWDSGLVPREMETSRKRPSSLTVACGSHSGSVRCLENQTVLGLGGAQGVEEDAYQADLFGQLRPLRRPVGGAVVKPRPAPPRRNPVPAPLDDVGTVGARSHVAHAPGHPVRAARARGVGQEGPVVGDSRTGHGHRAVVGEEVGVEQHPPFVFGRCHHVEHGLVLETGITALEPGRPGLERDLEPGVVPQLAQPGPDGLPGRDPGQVSLGPVVLGLDPSARLGAVGILEPAVRVRDELAVVVVDLVAFRGDEGRGFGASAPAVRGVCRRHPPQSQDGGRDHGQLAARNGQ